MIPASTIAKIACLGLSAAQAEAVAAMLTEVELATEAKSDAAIEARRANDRERKERQRHGKSREVTGQDVTIGTEKPAVLAEKPVDPSRTRVHNLEEEGYIERKQEDRIDAQEETETPTRKPKGDAAALAILGAVLSPDVAAGVVEYRRKIRKPVTAMAAEGLAKAFKDTGRRGPHDGRARLARLPRRLVCA